MTRRAGKAKRSIVGLQRFAELEPARELDQHALGVAEQPLRLQEQRVAVQTRAIAFELP